MLRRSIALFVVTASVLVSAVIALAQETNVTTRGDIVNVRSGPSLDHVVRAVLNNGYSVIATGRSDFDLEKSCRGELWNDGDMWLRVQFDEMEGWVNRCAVEIHGDLAGLPLAEPTFPEVFGDTRPIYPVLEADATTTAGQHISVFTRADAIVREAPSLGANVIGTVAELEMVDVIGRSAGGGWVQVQYGETQGWAARHLLRLPLDWLETVPVK